MKNAKEERPTKILYSSNFLVNHETNHKLVLGLDPAKQLKKLYLVFLKYIFLANTGVDVQKRNIYFN